MAHGREHCHHRECSLRLSPIVVLGICCCCTHVWGRVALPAETLSLLSRPSLPYALKDHVRAPGDSPPTLSDLEVPSQRRFAKAREEGTESGIRSVDKGLSRVHERNSSSAVHHRVSAEQAILGDDQRVSGPIHDRNRGLDFENDAKPLAFRTLTNRHGGGGDADHHDHPLEPHNASCWTISDALSSYNLSQHSNLTQEEFENLCPALLHRLYSGSCKHSSHDDDPAFDEISTAQKWGYGLASVVVVSVVSLVGVFILPVLNRTLYFYVLQGFIALGVGTLTGDAMLHLFPQALGLHSHGGASEQHGHGSNDGADNQQWKFLAAVGAIYAFFLWEQCLHWFVQKKSHKDNGHSHSEENHTHIPGPEAFTMTRSESQSSACEASDTEKKSVESAVLASSQDSHRHHFLGIAPLAWMVLLGDSIHNFVDGLALAAAFTGLGSGLSTTIAIFCHELPHELGDFAILLSTGMSFRKALAINLLSALACVAGFVIGMPIADHVAARQWILVVVAGMFLYIGLVDMLPELKREGKSIKMVLVQNIGLLAGLSLMLVIAVFEHDLHNLLSFD